VDIREIIDHGPMTGLQLRAVSFCFFLNMLDGVDVLSISFAAPILSRDWHIDPTTLGVLTSAALAGMMAGSTLLAPLGDAIGRRRLLMFSLLLIAIGMLGVLLAGSLPSLLALRFVTGCGLGGVVPTMAAFAAELSPERRRSFAVTAVSAGYPLGATLTGLAALWMLPHLGWQSLFVLGGGVTLLSVPLVLALLPESPDFLLSRQPAGALERLNAFLRALGQADLKALPPRRAAPREANRVAEMVAGLGSLFSAKHRGPTLLLWIAFVMSLATQYFLQLWTPQLGTLAGLTDAQASWAGTLLNLGLFAGNASVGWFADQFGLRRVIATYLGAGALLLLFFSYLHGMAAMLSGLGAIGIMQGGFIGLYAVGARIYPTEIRMTGIGWAAGIGRLGSILGPFFAGLLVARHVDMAGTFLAFAIPLALASLAVASMRSPELAAPARAAPRAAANARG
jgi:benzoate transport